MNLDSQKSHSYSLKWHSCYPNVLYLKDNSCPNGETYVLHRFGMYRNYMSLPTFATLGGNTHAIIDYRLTCGRFEVENCLLVCSEQLKKEKGCHITSLMSTMLDCPFIALVIRSMWCCSFHPLMRQ